MTSALISTDDFLRALALPNAANDNEPVGSKYGAAFSVGTDPFDLDTHDGLLGQISHWITNTARTPVPEFSTFAALAFLSAFYGRRYVTPTGAGLNLYLIAIGGPGFGKDHPKKAIQKLGFDSGFHRLIGPNAVTSDAAIEKVLRHRPVFVMPWDEVGIVFQSVTGRQATSWERAIRKALLELYSLSTSIWTGKEYADRSRDSCGEPIHYPTVSVLGLSTPTEFYRGLTEQNLDDGLVARMCIVHPTNRPNRQDTPPVLAVPPNLINELRKARSAWPNNTALMSIDDPTNPPALFAVNWDDLDTHRHWMGIEDWQIEQVEAFPEAEGIIGRAAEQTIKFATIRAISRDPVRPTVTCDDVDWGYAIVQRSLDTIELGVRRYMSGSEHERVCKAISRHVELAGPGGIPRSVLMRKEGLAKVTPRDFETALKWLVDVGDITPSIAGSKGGRPGARYTWATAA